MFPDEYHLETLDEFLVSCGKLSNSVDIRVVLGALTERLTRFASNSEENRELTHQARVFETFQHRLPIIIETFSGTTSCVEFLRLFLSLLKLVLVVKSQTGNYKTLFKAWKGTSPLPLPHAAAR